MRLAIELAPHHHEKPSASKGRFDKNAAAAYRALDVSGPQRTVAREVPNSSLEDDEFLLQEPCGRDSWFALCVACVLALDISHQAPAFDESPRRLAAVAPASSPTSRSRFRAPCRRSRSLCTRPRVVWLDGTRGQLRRRAGGELERERVERVRGVAPQLEMQGTQLLQRSQRRREEAPGVTGSALSRQTHRDLLVRLVVVECALHFNFEVFPLALPDGEPQCMRSFGSSQPHAAPRRLRALRLAEGAGENFCVPEPACAEAEATAV
ncbi:hypothetical protein TGPRC2_423890 [Toxoplasma gondii TgCatPRC2]|uniref:Uncharacterized protein n=1 Tax=Toxoplasma gondii TgCatPRC2 TaxID=1130821 RepID=A0A151HKG6_TOXGO|nr:hypothetical protein TGPRC2_423890 [Toxoplasma gondii TgCatPRC2]